MMQMAFECYVFYINPQSFALIAACVRSATFIFPRMLVTWFLTVPLAIYRREAMIIAANKAIKRGDRIILSAAFALPKIKYISLE